MRPELPADRRTNRLLTFLRFFGVPFLVGAAAVLGFAPFGFYAVPVISLTALLLLWQRCRRARSAAAIGFSFGAGKFLAGTSWVYVSLHDYGGMAVPVAAFATLLFCLIQACYPALVGAVLLRWRAPAAVRLMLLFPALWAISEWLRGWVLSGFPWLSVGYAHVPSSPLAGYAPVLGVFGVSLVAAVIAGATASVLQAFLHRSDLPDPRARRVAIVTGVGVAVGLVVAGAALKTHPWTQPLAGAPTSVSLLQGNIPQELKWRRERAQATLQSYLELARASDSKLILLPETALPMLNVDIPTGLSAGPGRPGGAQRRRSALRRAGVRTERPLLQQRHERGHATCSNLSQTSSGSIR